MQDGLRAKAANGFYAAVVTGTVVMMGGLAYVIGKELVSPGGIYPAIDSAVKRLEHDTRVQNLLGPGTLALYGPMPADGDLRGGRRRPLIKESLLLDGRRNIDASFVIRGSNESARVAMTLLEGEKKGIWHEDYLALELPGQPTQILISPPLKPVVRSGWNLFSRFF